MAIKLTVESFLSGVRQSGLIPERRLEEALQELNRRARPGDPPPEADAISAELVSRKLITAWQAGKLLQGKFKGFVLGRYRLLDLLGRGEMSTVYLAEHVRMKRRCAIKVLPANKVKDTSYLGRFLREAEAVAALDHPNIVRAYDVDQEEEAGTEIHFLAMEYVEGKDLEQLLAQREKFTPVEAAEFIRQAAEGLAHAHENGLIHRDIKPGNLLVDSKGTVKLLDLGLARFFRAEEEESLTIKHDEKVLGTADYLAPEQAVDSHAVDERADIYGLGCTLYFALTGQPPFTDGTLVQRLLAHQTKAPPPIGRFRDDVPQTLEAILFKMLEKRKEDRYQSSRDAADALSTWLVQNANDEWRRQHPAVVAAVVGLDHLSPPPVESTDLAIDEDEAIPLAPSAAQAPPTEETRKKRKSAGPVRAAMGVPSTQPESVAGRHPVGAGQHSPEAVIRAARPKERTAVSSENPPMNTMVEPHVATETVHQPSARTLWQSLGTRQGLMLLALVLTGIMLVTGIGVTLRAVTTTADEPATTNPTDQDGLQRGRMER